MERNDGDGYEYTGGVNGDMFPSNSEQWQDSDNDGYGDNSNGLDGDTFIDEPSGG